MVRYTRKEIRKIEADARAELGLVLSRYVCVTQSQEALETILSRKAVDREEIRRIAKDYGLMRDTYNLDDRLCEFRLFTPQLASFLRHRDKFLWQRDRITLAREDQREALDKDERYERFRVLGMYPEDIKVMVKRANRCEMLFHRYMEQVSEKVIPETVDFAEINNKLFPQIVPYNVFNTRCFFSDWQFTLGPRILIPWDEIKGGFPEKYQNLV